MNPCIHCGKQHDLQARTCPVTGKSLVSDGGASKTIFGIAPPIAVALAPAAKSASAEPSLAPAPAAKSASAEPSLAPAPAAKSASAEPSRDKAPLTAAPPASPSRLPAGSGNKTMYGMAAPVLAAPTPPTSPSVPLSSPVAPAPAAPVRPSASVPLVAPPPPPPPKLRAPDLEKTPAVVLPAAVPAPKPAAARTMLMINPGLVKPEGVPAPMIASPGSTGPKLPVSPAPATMTAQEEIPTKPNPLPSTEEARRNPDLVVSIDVDVEPQPADPMAATSMVRGNVPVPAPAAAGFELDLPPAPAARPKADSAAFPPVDVAHAPAPVKKAASTARVAKQAAPRAHSSGDDFKDALRCIVESAIAYRARWRSLLIVTAMLMFPAMAIESCVTTALTGVLVPKAVVAVQDSAIVQRYRDLKERLEESHAKGTLDQQAAAELAALEPVLAVGVTSQVALSTGPSAVVATILRIVIGLVSGLLIFGLAVPLAYAVGGLAAANQMSNAEPPAWSDVWPILMRRRQLFFVSLLTAAIIVAVGYALFVLPGLVASVLLVFVPHVVLFEQQSGKPALLRSLELVKRDAIRVCVVLLASMVASGIVYKLADLVIPDWGRPLLFVQALLGNVLFVAVMPIFTGALGRLYVEQRQREGGTADELSQASRS